MSEKDRRELTTLEYIVLGLISMEPQSGYSIVNYFEDSNYSWSGSPGSIYPMLKRLEKQAVISGELEMAYETRPRKVYTLTPLGEELLDAWLVKVPKMRPFYEQREMALMRFQFMEKRFSIKQTLQWLDNYRDQVIMGEAHRRSVHDAMLREMSEAGLMSPYQSLILESIVMDLSTLRTWIDMARSQLMMVAHQTGEFKTLSEDAE